MPSMTSVPEVRNVATIKVRTTFRKPKQAGSNLPKTTEVACCSQSSHIQQEKTTSCRLHRGNGDFGRINFPKYGKPV